MATGPFRMLKLIPARKMATDIVHIEGILTEVSLADREVQIIPLKVACKLFIAFGFGVPFVPRRASTRLPDKGARTV